jgi:hypothetical protein
VARDLLRCQTPRDQPEDLDLAIGERKAGARMVQQHAAGHRPADERAER